MILLIIYYIILIIYYFVFTNIINKKRSVVEQLNTRKRQQSCLKRYITVPCSPLCHAFIYMYAQQSTYVTYRLRDL
jgi:hypothetical protein